MTTKTEYVIVVARYTDGLPQVLVADSGALPGGEMAGDKAAKVLRDRHGIFGVDLDLVLHADLSVAVYAGMLSSSAEVEAGGLRGGFWTPVEAIDLDICRVVKDHLNLRDLRPLDYTGPGDGAV